MTEERLKKIKVTTILGAVVAMGGIVALQFIIRMLMSGGGSGIQLAEVDLASKMVSMMKSMAIFGIIGAVSGFAAGALTPVEEKKQPTHVRREGDEDDNEAAQETLAKLGIPRDQDKPRSQ